MDGGLGFQSYADSPKKILMIRQPAPGVCCGAARSTTVRGGGARAVRSYYNPGGRFDNLGFRVVVSPGFRSLALWPLVGLASLPTVERIGLQGGRPAGPDDGPCVSPSGGLTFVAGWVYLAPRETTRTTAPPSFAHTPTPSAIRTPTTSIWCACSTAMGPRRTRIAQENFILRWHRAASRDSTSLRRLLRCATRLSSLR